MNILPKMVSLPKAERVALGSQAVALAKRAGYGEGVKLWQLAKGNFTGTDQNVARFFRDEFTTTPSEKAAAAALTKLIEDRRQSMTGFERFSASVFDDVGNSFLEKSPPKQTFDAPWGTPLWKANQR